MLVVIRNLLLDGCQQRFLIPRVIVATAIDVKGRGAVYPAADAAHKVIADTASMNMVGHFIFKSRNVNPNADAWCFKSLLESCC